MFQSASSIPPAPTPWSSNASPASTRALALTGDSLGAELDGHLIAAVAIDGTASLADPFASTADVRALLELRASQLRAA